MTTTMRWCGLRGRWLLTAVGLVLVGTSCGVHPAARGPAQPSSSAVLVSGVVNAGPVCPVERPGDMCKPRPVGDARVEARSLSAEVVARTRTRADGRYSFRLGRGRYMLVAVTRQVFPRCPDVQVSVTSAAPIRASIHCDTGIR